MGCVPLTTLRRWIRGKSTGLPCLAALPRNGRAEWTGSGPEALRWRGTTGAATSAVWTRTGRRRRTWPRRTGGGGNFGRAAVRWRVGRGVAGSVSPTKKKNTAHRLSADPAEHDVDAGVVGLRGPGCFDRGNLGGADVAGDAVGLAGASTRQDQNGLADVVTVY